MAAPYNPPVKNEDFMFSVALENYSSPGNFKTTPTIAAGDFKIVAPGSPSELVNLTTLPVNDPPGSIWVKIYLSAAEMNQDQVLIQGIDQTATKEWADFAACILTTSS